MTGYAVDGRSISEMFTLAVAVVRLAVELCF